MIGSRNSEFRVLGAGGLGFRVAGLCDRSRLFMPRYKV